MRRIYLALILALVFHAAVFFINPSAKRTDAERPPATSSLTIRFNTLYASKPSEQIFPDIAPEPQVSGEPPQPPEIIPEPELVEHKPVETLEKPAPEIIRKKESKPMPQKQEVASPSETEESIKEPEFHNVHAAADDSSLINISNREEKTTSSVIIARPRYKENDAPVYPQGALRRRLQGNVNLRVFVKEDGTPGDVILQESSGYSILDDAAIKAVSKWRFEAGLENSRPVAMWVEIPIKFSLE